MRLIRDILLYQVVWLTAVVAGARGAGWVGLAAAAALAIVFADAPGRVLRLVTWLLASMAAWTSDAGVRALGGVEYADHSPGWLPSPLWMLALWLNFTVMAGPILGFLRGRFVLAAAVGAVGGPLAYVGAAGLGAVSVPQTVGPMSLVAIQFALAVPLLIAVSRATPQVAPAAGESAA